jgi:RNA polymerase sigma-70 factor (ECF subfamily)
MPNRTLAVVMQENSSPEFDELFREHHRLIYRTAFGITGRSADAEDVLQTIFLRLLGREFPPDLQRNPRAYLYRSAVNASLNMIRSRRRQIQIQDVDKIAEIPDTPATDSNDETERRLLQAIGELNDKAVEILMLRYAHDYSDAEIAKMLGTSRGTIAVSLFRSRAQLKKLMRASGENL